MAVTSAATANLLFAAAVPCYVVLGLRVFSYQCRHPFWHHPEIWLPSSYAAAASFLQPSNSPNGGQKCITSFGSTHRTARLWASSTMGDAPRRIFVCGLTAASRFHADSGGQDRRGFRRVCRGMRVFPVWSSVSSSVTRSCIALGSFANVGRIRIIVPDCAHILRQRLSNLLDLATVDMSRQDLKNGTGCVARIDRALLARSWNSLGPSPIKSACVPSR
jgi:hypothetical protein